MHKYKSILCSHEKQSLIHHIKILYKKYYKSAFFSVYLSGWLYCAILHIKPLGISCNNNFTVRNILEQQSNCEKYPATTIKALKLPCYNKKLLKIPCNNNQIVINTMQQQSNCYKYHATTIKLV